MKESIEDQFKSAFEKYELPYNENAWASMNQKLDQLNVNPKPSVVNNTWKWVTGGAITVTAICALVYTMSTHNKNNAPMHSSTITQNSSTSIESNSHSTPAEVKNVAIASTPLATNAKTEIHSNATPIEKAVPAIDVKANNANSDRQPIMQGSGNGSASCSGVLNPKNTSSQESRNNAVFIQEISDYCFGEVKAIRNSNEKQTLYIIHPSGTLTEVPANQSIYFKATEAGTHYISADGKSKEVEFFVRPTEKVELTVDDNTKYEDGLPTTIVTASRTVDNLEWSINGKVVGNNDTKMVAHLYKRGTHTITLKGKDHNGCELQKTKTIRMEEDYNLLAPMAFSPESSDPRKNHFIPYALTVRNIAFKMIIIDPKTGAVVFETSSVEGWNGVDRTTNQLSEMNKQYIWKVTLMNPEENEPREYKGIVVRL